jgi:membrane-bound lytic murein transglycosylase D
MIAPGLLCAVLFSAGCETDQPKKTATKLPPHATAPTAVASKTAPAAPPPAVAPATAPSPQSQATDALIAQAEKLYAAGQADYRSGHLDAAKQNFDQAFNVLLSSKIEVRDNPPLEHEFDKIVEGVRQLEMVALQQGDGFTEQRSEPAPIDEANDITFPVDPKIRAQAEAEIKTTKSDLPLVH